MRILVPAIAFAGLVGFASAAFAMQATGTIKMVDSGKDRVTLDNGMSYMAPKSVSLSAFKVGEKVTINYAKSGDKMDITSITPAS